MFELLDTARKIVVAAHRSQQQRPCQGTGGQAALLSVTVEFVELVGVEPDGEHDGPVQIPVLTDDIIRRVDPLRRLALSGEQVLDVGHAASRCLR